jgi:dienelactone hydrolase
MTSCGIAKEVVMRKTSVFFVAVCVALIISAGGFGKAKAAVVGKNVEYSAQGTVLKGYIAYDDKIKEQRPGILVVHEWWGLNDYARKRARMLAKLGYTALAVDMYGDGKVAMHPDDANKFSSEVMKNFDTGKARFLAAEEFLKKQSTVDPKRIGAIGYCFGGGVVLNMARQGADLAAVASFHGSLTAVQPAQPGMVKAKIRVYTGGSDKFNPPAAVEAFKKEMTEAKADYKVTVYPGALHSFTNPGSTELGKKYNLPLAYNKKADQASWKAMQKFFKSVFKE